MTDVTGFGLIGHLGEMLSASLVGAAIDPSAIPLYDGALELARAGIVSTLLPENPALASLLHGEVDVALRARLFDPQTSGPLLAGVPAVRAEACVAALRSAGARHAAIIGHAGGAVAAPRDVRIIADVSAGVPHRH
jgi:selenide, water dikinase